MRKCAKMENRVIKGIEIYKEPHWIEYHSELDRPVCIASGRRISDGQFFCAYVPMTNERDRLLTENVVLEHLLSFSSCMCGIVTYKSNRYHGGYVSRQRVCPQHSSVN